MIKYLNTSFVLINKFTNTLISYFEWLVYLCKRKLLSKTNANSRVLLMGWKLGIELKAFYCHFPTLSSLRRCFNRFSCTVSARLVPVLVVAASEMQRCMKWLQATAGLTNNAAEKTNWQTNTQPIRAEILGPFFMSQQKTTHTYILSTIIAVIWTFKYLNI